MKKMDVENMVQWPKDFKDLIDGREKPIFLMVQNQFDEFHIALTDDEYLASDVIGGIVCFAASYMMERVKDANKVKEVLDSIIRIGIEEVLES